MSGDGTKLRSKLIAALKESDDLDERRAKVRSAVEAVVAALGHAPEDGWMEGYYDDFAVYRVDSGEDSPLYFKVPYTVAEDGEIEAGEAVAVEVETSYTPLSGTTESEPTTEADSGGVVEFVETGGKLIALEVSEHG